MIQKPPSGAEPGSTATGNAKEHKKPNTKRGKSSSQSRPPGRLACDICRERKVGCDRGDPKCGRCSRLGYDCSYQGRKRHRAAQADLPRQLSELQDRLAQAEAILKSTSSAPAATPASFFQQTDLPWQTISPPGTYSSNDQFMHHPQNHVSPPADRGFEGLDMFANLAGDIPDFWDNALNEYLSPSHPNTPTIDDSSIGDEMTRCILVNRTYPALVSDALPPLSTPTQLPTPLETSGIPTSYAAPHGPSLYPGSQETDEEISPQNLSILHQNYFEVFYPVLPILSRSRFLKEQTREPTSPRVCALSYGIALVGSTISPKYAHLQQACYTNARKYVELCERDDDEAHLTSLNIFQTLLFIIRYELTKHQFVRAWMTLGRAVTLAQMLDLQHLDSETSSSHQADHQKNSSSEIAFLPMKDFVSLEEMRRSFWTLYIFESYASVRTGRPCSLEEDKLRIHLPSPGELNEGFLPSPMPFLSEPAKLSGLTQLSSYAAVTIMVKLARICFEHVGILSKRPNDSGFWDRHYQLVKMTNDYTAIFRGHLHVQAVKEDPLAFSLHLNLCATHINLHEAAIRKVQEQELPALVAAESRKCSSAAAFKIQSAVRMNWPLQRSERDFFTLQGTFIGWPLFMSMKSLSRNLADSGDATSAGIMDSLRFLRAALDQVEESAGYWHKASASTVPALDKWDQEPDVFKIGEGWNGPS